MHGRLITLEGGEGAGKSTQAQRVCAWLRARGRVVELTREPGGTELAEAIRALVLRRWTEGIDPPTELLLMFAARAAHVRGLIQPRLAAGVDVVCDRFIDSSYAYQGAGQGIELRHVQALEALVLPALRPHLTLVLDLPPELGLARARQRGEANRFEDETLAFMRRVRECFLARAAADPQRCAVIDASGNPDSVFAGIVAVLEQRL
ncbi:dTMP kinase [Fontimonas sp. SYSU GA230001]|uniref:dTMP kinase n=1 Tax=Fontimonas sp. SYSU GA230001 TaxID=3142450 RepID=UPI0032B54BC5